MVLNFKPKREREREKLKKYLLYDNIFPRIIHLKNEKTNDYLERSPCMMGKRKGGSGNNAKVVPAVLMDSNFDIEILYALRGYYWLV